jgi:hypothetical protein
MAVFLIDTELDSGIPQGSANASDIDSFIQNLKAAIIERLELEHYSIEQGAAGTSQTIEDANAQGRHIPGLVGVLGMGTVAERNALGTPGEGALYYCTDEDGIYPEGTLYRYDNGWAPETQFTTGTIYASQAEVTAGTVSNKALAPLTYETDVTTRYAKFHEALTSGNDSADSPMVASSWNKRTITEDVNTITGVSVASSVITIPAGTYRAYASAPAVGGPITGIANHVIRLRDTTNNINLLTGIKAVSEGTAGTRPFHQTNSIARGQFTVAGTVNIELQHYIENANQVGGLAMSVTATDEVYSVLELWRIS